MKVEFRSFDGPFDWGWVNLQVPILRVEDTSGIMAIDSEKNETVGACIFDNWTPNSVQAHFMIASPLVLKHKFIEEILDYVFNVQGKKVMYGLVPGNNEAALKLNKHLGFTEVIRLEEAFAPEVDYVLMELKKENCRLLPTVPRVM